MQNNINRMRALGLEEIGRPSLRLQSIPDPIGASEGSPDSNKPIPFNPPSLAQTKPTSNQLNVELFASMTQETIVENMQSEEFQMSLNQTISLKTQNWVDKMLAELKRSTEDASSQTHLSEHEENSTASRDSQQPVTTEDLAQLLRFLEEISTSDQTINPQFIKKLTKQVTSDIVAALKSPGCRESIRKKAEDISEALSNQGNPFNSLLEKNFSNLTEAFDGLSLKTTHDNNLTEAFDRLSLNTTHDNSAASET